MDLNFETYIMNNILPDNLEKRIKRLELTDSRCFDKYVDQLVNKAEQAFTQILSEKSSAERNFLEDIYSYGDMSDFTPEYINSYMKNSYRLFLNSLAHIPSNFHIDLYESYVGELFEDTQYSYIENEVERKFIELNEEVMNAFLDELNEIYENEKIFYPEDIYEYEKICEEFRKNHFSIDYVDYNLLFENELTNNGHYNSKDVSLVDKDELFQEFFKQEVYGNLIQNSTCQEPFTDESFLFDEPLLEKFAFLAKDKLEGLGYEVAIFKDLRESSRYDTYCAFAYASDKENLQEVINYMNEKNESYEQMYSSIELQEEVKNIKKLRR